MPDELDREAVLGYAEQLAGELTEVADHLQRAVAAFQATLAELQRWLEGAGRPAEGPPSGVADGVPPLDPAQLQERERPARDDRRSGADRRSGEDRRVFVAEGLAGRIIRSLERREEPERRSGLERRGELVPGRREV